MNSAETLVYVYQGRNLFLNFLSNILMKGNQISFFGLQVCSPLFMTYFGTKLVVYLGQMTIFKNNVEAKFIETENSTKIISCKVTVFKQPFDASI